MEITSGPDLAADIERLGTTPEEIAETCRRDGDTGVIAEPECCVLVTRLTRLGHTGVTVWKEHNENGDLLEIDTDTDAYYATATTPLFRFVDAFDAGHYPDLISPSLVVEL